MKSYTVGRALYGSLTNLQSSANLTLGDQIANDRYREVCAMKDWPFLHRLRTATTVASTTFANLAYDIDQVESVFVTVGTTRYNPKPAPSRQFWDQLHYSVQTNDTPQYWIAYDGQIGLWPRPSTAGSTISMNSKIRVIDLGVADYTTGSIVSVANGGTAVVGTGTTWTERMAGRWIRMTYSNTANTGDGEWYEISSVGSATTLTLVRPYGGTAIAAGTASYTIGQMPLLPESHHTMPWIGAVADYWDKENDDRGPKYQKKYDDALTSLIRNWSSPNTSMVIDSGEEETIINPNLNITI